MNPQYQEQPKIIYSRCLPFCWKHRWMQRAKLLTTHANSSRHLWCCYTIFTRAMRFQVLDQLENLTPIWKCTEFKLSFVFCLNNFEGLSFFILFLHTKDLLLHGQRHDLAVDENVNYSTAITWKEKENQVNRENLRCHCFISTIVKNPIYK